MVLNTLISSSGAGITYFLVQVSKNFENQNLAVVYDPVDLINAVQAGLVSVTACSNITEIDALVIGSIGAVIFISS